MYPPTPHSWNPGCLDVIDTPAFYVNLVQGLAASEMPDDDLPDPTPCGGRCPTKSPLCREVSAGNFACTVVQCVDAIPYCNQSAVVGVRSRQLCPITCGCDQPRGPLALTLPNGGCPETCALVPTYTNVMDTIPCEDVPVGDPGFLAFLDAYEQNAAQWPQDWRVSSWRTIGFMRQYGCDYITQTAVRRAHHAHHTHRCTRTSFQQLHRSPANANELDSAVVS